MSLDQESLREAEIEAARRLFADPANRIQAWAFTAFVFTKRGADPVSLCGDTTAPPEMRVAIATIQKLVNAVLNGTTDGQSNGKVGGGS